MTPGFMARRFSRSYKRKITRRAILIVTLVFLTVTISWLMWHPRSDASVPPTSGDVPTGQPPE